MNTCICFLSTIFCVLFEYQNFINFRSRASDTPFSFATLIKHTQSLEQVAADMNILYNRSIVREVNQEMIRTARFEFCLLTAEMTDEADGMCGFCH